MASLQDTFVPLGFSRTESAKLSATLTELALDVASFNNKIDADVVRDFQSAIVGNHETVKKYGVIINEAAIEQEAIKLGLIEHKSELMEFHKVQARVNLLMEGTKDAQGDISRTSHTLTNQIKSLSSQFTKLKEALGESNEESFKFLINLTKLGIGTAGLLSKLGNTAKETHIFGNRLVGLGIEDIVKGFNLFANILQKTSKEGLENSKNKLINLS